MYPTETEVVDTVTDCEVLTVPARDEAYEGWLDDVERNRQAELDAEQAAMLAAGEADGCDAAPFHDLTAERYAELMAAYPESTGGWSPCIAYTAGAARPFAAQLRRGTPDGPDVAHAGEYLTAECALVVAVAFAWDMVFAHTHGTEEHKAAIRAKITYAKR